MSSGSKRVLRKSLSFRIAFLYACLYIVSSFLAFAGFYLIISSVLNEEINDDLVSDVRELELLLEDEGFEQLVDEINHEAQADGFENAFFRILSLEGELLEASSLEEWEGLPLDQQVIRDLAESPGSADNFRIVSFSMDRKEYQVRTIYSLIASDYILQIGLTLEENSLFLALLRNTFFLLILVIVLLSFLIAYLISRRALKGVEAVTAAALQISQGGALNRKVDINTKDDEIIRLAETFNRMLAHIELLMNELKEINDNIAHDLKTPITRIRGLAEVTLTSRQSTIDEYKNLGADTIEECDNLLEMIESMLYISKADAGIVSIRREPLDLCDTIRSACELFGPPAEDRNIIISSELPVSCEFQGEPGKIQRMIANLLDNALKYSREKGEIHIRLEKDNKEIRIFISDNGIGIPPEKLPLIFKRFYRCQDHPEIAGNGLGLSLVQAIVKQHGGRIAASSERGKGSCFALVFPSFNEMVMKG